MSEQIPPTTPAASMPRVSPRALIAGAAVAVVAIGGLLAYLLPHQFANSAAGTTSDPTKTGCPSAAAPPSRSAANVIVVERQEGTSIVVHVGGTVDFRLTANKFRWDYAPAANSAVQVESPAGYYDPTLKDCIWRLKATAAGQNVVTFQRRMLCPPHTSLLCSDIVILWRYVLNVQ